MNILTVFKREWTYLLIFFCLLIVIACDRSDRDQPKVGMFVFGEGYSDAGWRENCRKGIMMAFDEFEFDTLFLSAKSGLQEVMDEFPKQGVDLLVLGGMVAEAEMLVTARNNPEMKFVIVDDRYTGDLKNVRSIDYAGEEACFPLGFLAAAWAELNDPEQPVVGIVAGMDLPPVRRLFEAYEMGVNHFNNSFSREVGFRLSILNSFDDDGLGYLVGDSLVNYQGADVIAVLAGNAGNGSLRAAKANGKWGVGIDVDQYYSLPDVKDILLSSCIKRLDTTIYTVTVQYLSGQADVEMVHLGTLANHGVALAPYHKFDALIPDSIKQAVTSLKNDIIDGKRNPRL
ncbi:MAG TPA: BMP family ABC transporter substrate-binding protein [Prolixibacteraceae bacterium]|nr:BMP family ABC transporter substrate-binding protein [Prolixibacteraceae bacterium]